MGLMKLLVALALTACAGSAGTPAPHRGGDTGISTHEGLAADRGAFEDYDLERARTQGYGFARLQRLAIEHLIGVR